ncbi:MAG: glucosaminidase domain-containing protein [Muribaculaceae bacterium]|nr:glucosaminidase domain-containing protein [Muribaculaceae bacterium]
MKRLFLLFTLCAAIVFNSQAATPIIGKPNAKATVDRMYQFGLSKGAGGGNSNNFNREICQAFYDLGHKYGIRGDIALCQSFIETGWFKYTGGTAMRYYHHNYCGLGVTGLGVVGCTFSTIQEGVAAQLQHLWSYATTRALPSGWTLVDPRFNHGYRGKAPNWENLGSGLWAAASGYGSSILSIYNEMMAFQMPEPKITSSQNTITFTAEQGSTPPSISFKITGQNLSANIVYNSSTSSIKVTTSNWDNTAGGTMTATVDTSKAPGSYSGIIAIQSGSGDNKVRIEIPVSVTITAKLEPSITASPSSLSFSAQRGETVSAKTINVSAKDLSTDMVYGSNTSMITVSPASGWNARTGGSLNVTINTDRAAGTYEGYVYVQTSSSLRQQIAVTVTITSGTTIDPVDPTINVNTNSLSFTAKQGANVASQAVTVTASNLTADMIYGTNSSMFTVTPASGWNARTGGTLNISIDTNRDPGTYTGYAYVQTSSSLRQQIDITATITAPSTDPIPALDFVQIWNNSQQSGSTTVDGVDFTKIRNMDYMDGKLYCVYNTSEIIILDAHTGKKLGTLNNGDIVKGGTLTLCGIKCHDGRVWACNLKGNDNTELRVYCWDSDDANPMLAMSTTSTQGVSRLGDCMWVTGDYGCDLWLSFARHENSATSIVEFNRNCSGNWTSKKVNATASGSNIAAGASARVKATGQGYWLDGQLILPTYLGLDGAKQYALTGEAVTSGNDFDTFTYNSRQYAMVASYLNQTSTYTEGMMRLYDITNGWDKASAIAAYPSSGLGSTRNTNCAGSVITQAYTRAAEAWILTAGQGIAYFRSGKAEDIGDTVDPVPDDKPTDLPDKFANDWCYSVNNKVISADYIDLSTSQPYTRNMALYGDNLYIVQRSASDANIVIANKDTGRKTGTLPTDGITPSGSWRFSSVAAIEDAILACNLATSASSTLYVYAWTSGSSNPTQVLATTNHGARAGDLISASGTLANGKIYFASNTGYAGKIYIYTITNGTANATPQEITLKDASGTTYDLGGGFAVIDIKANADGTFYASGKGDRGGLFNADGTMIKQFNATATGNNTYGSSFCPVEFGDFTLGVHTSYGGKDIDQGYLNLINITNGIDNASIIKSHDKLSNDASVRNTTFVTSAIARSKGREISMWVLIPGQGIAKYVAGQGSSTTSAGSLIEGTKPYIMLDGTTARVQGAETVNMTAYNLSGMAIIGGTDSLDTSALNPGMYIIMARLTDGQAITTKVIVR